MIAAFLNVAPSLETWAHFDRRDIRFHESAFAAWWHLSRVGMDWRDRLDTIR